MIEWISLGVAVFTLISWMITTYLSFMRNRPKLVVKAPRYVEGKDEWDIYVYNEGNRATRMLEQFSCIDLQEGKIKISKNGDFRPENRKVYVNVNPGEYHHFYTSYRWTKQKSDKFIDRFLEEIEWGMKGRMYLEINYDNGRKTKLYQKYIKLDQYDVNLFIQEKIHDKIAYLGKDEEKKEVSD